MLNLLFVVLLACKVCGLTDISWWWVCAPLALRWLLILFAIVEIAFCEFCKEKGAKVIEINIFKKKKEEDDAESE